MADCVGVNYEIGPTGFLRFWTGLIPLPADQPTRVVVELIVGLVRKAVGESLVFQLGEERTDEIARQYASHTKRADTHHLGYASFYWGARARRCRVASVKVAHPVVADT